MASVGIGVLLLSLLGYFLVVPAIIPHQTLEGVKVPIIGNRQYPIQKDERGAIAFVVPQMGGSTPTPLPTLTTASTQAIGMSPNAAQQTATWAIVSGSACGTTAGEAIRTVVGIYDWAANPCLESPCPPGMVLAVKSGGITYILSSPDSTEYQHWIWSIGKSWPPAETVPAIGTTVMVTGILAQRTDFSGQSFYEIKVQSLLQCHSEGSTIVCPS